MTKEEMIAFLKENLTVSVILENEYGYYSSNGVKVRVTISLGDEKITESSDSVSLPT